MLRTIKAVVLVATAFCLPVNAYFACAQELPKHLGSDPYVVELSKLFQQWNSHKLTLPPKSQLKDVFNNRLVEIVKQRKYPYQDDRWAQMMRKQFDELPEQVKPKKTLEPQAEVVLTLLFLKDKADFEKRIPLQKLKEELNLPLFLIFSRADMIATKSTASNIDTHVILGATLEWWTTIWPFCG